MRTSVVLGLSGFVLALATVRAPAQDAEWQAFTDAGWKAARQGDHPGAKELLEKALHLAEGFAPADGRRALTRAYLAFAAAQRGAASEARDHAKQAAAMLDPLPLDSPHRGKGYFALGLTAAAAGNHDAADAHLRRAIESEEKQRGSSHLVVVQMLATRAEILEAGGRFAEAEPLRKQQVAALDVSNNPDRVGLAVAAHRQAAAFYLRWNRGALAEPHLARVVEIAREQEFTEAKLAEHLSDFGELLVSLRKFDRAEPVLKEALKIREAALNLSPAVEQGELARCLHAVGAMYVAQGRYFPAEPLLDRALAIREKALGDDLRTAETLNILAVGHTGQKSYRKAEIELLKALKIRESVLGPSHLTVAATHEDLAAVYVQANHAEAAEASLLKAVAIREKAVGELHPSLIGPLHTLANLYRDTKRPGSAEPLYRRVIQARERAAGKANPALPGVLDDYAALLRQSQKADEAAGLAARAAAIRAKYPGKNE